MVWFLGPLSVVQIPVQMRPDLLLVVVLVLVSRARIHLGCRVLCTQTYEE